MYIYILIQFAFFVGQPSWLVASTGKTPNSCRKKPSFFACLHILDQSSELMMANHGSRMFEAEESQFLVELD